MTTGIPTYKELPLSKHLKTKNFVTLPQQYIYNTSIFFRCLFDVYPSVTNNLLNLLQREQVQDRLSEKSTIMTQGIYT